MATARVIRTASAARRGESVRAHQPAPAPAPTISPRKRGVVEERGGGSVRTSMARRREVYDETDQEVEVLRERFEDGVEPAHVQVSAGLTINMGNFESLRIDCSVRIPCRPERINEAYEIATDFVSEKVAEEQARWGAVPSKGR